MLAIISLLAWNATQRNGIHYNQYQSGGIEFSGWFGSTYDREFKISPHALHLLRLVVSSLQLALKLLEIGLDGGHCHGAFGMVFRKEILLSARPNLGGFAVLLLRRDDDFDRILIDAVLDNIGIRKDPLEGLQGRNVFLLSTVSVPRISDGELGGCAHGRIVKSLSNKIDSLEE